MHVLIIPSEYVDEAEKPLDGIFQKDLAEILTDHGVKVGFLAIKPKYTTYDLIYKTLKRKLPFFLVLQLWKSHIKCSIFSINHSIKAYKKDGCSIVKFKGGFSFFSFKHHEKEKDLKRISDKAFQVYVSKFGKPDLIHAHCLVFAGIVANYLSSKYEIRTLLTEHSSNHYFKLYNRFTKKYLSNEFKKINLITGVSKRLSSFLEGFYELEEGSVKVLSNSYNQQFNLSNYPDTTPVDNTFKFINISSFEPLKNQSLLIDAFCNCFRFQPNVTLQIIGSGELENDLKSQASKFNMNKQVVFHDSVSRSELMVHLDKADCLVHTSNYETFGLVLAEAQAMGKPVLTTDCGIAKELINSETGIIVEPNNLEQLIFGMEQMVEQYKKFNPKTIAKRVREMYGRQEVYKQVMRLYKEVKI